LRRLYPDRQVAGCLVPESVLVRTLSATTPNLGGVTVETTVQKTLIDVSRPKSIVARAGGQLVNRLRGNISFPRQTLERTTDLDCGRVSDAGQ
jgi:hypothetical protein